MLRISVSLCNFRHNSHRTHFHLLMRCSCRLCFEWRTRPRTSDERRAGVSRFDSSSPDHIGWGVAIVPRSIRPLGNQRIGNEERMLNAISILHIRGVSNGRFQIDQKSISPRFGGDFFITKKRVHQFTWKLAQYLLIMLWNNVGNFIRVPSKVKELLMF